MGNLEADSIVQQGIKVLQQKLAAVLQELSGADEINRGALDGDLQHDNVLRSPDAGMENGYTTPFNQGATSAWGGAQTPAPYGATPYGQVWGN